MVDPSTARKIFHAWHGGEPRLFRAPARVNLVGEHTDYNKGLVLSMAIERDTVVAAAARADRTIKAHSLRYRQSESANLDRPAEKRGATWFAYVEQVARALEGRGMRIPGADLIIDSDIPIGAGLGSSSALEVGVGLALASTAGADVMPAIIALAGRKADTDVRGGRSGLTDQFVSALGQRDHAMLFDCRSLEARPIPMNVSRHAIVICDSREERNPRAPELVDRRHECELGAARLRAMLVGVESLRDVLPETFFEVENDIEEPVRRRCRHVITENARAAAAADSLERGDVTTLGRLMVRSHISLRNDYEVSSRELDILVDSALSIDGVVGARLTGGGLGGSTVNLVRTDALGDFQRSIRQKYERETGKTPAIYVTRAADGAGEITGQ